jgi:hypothetical protein
MMPDLNPEERKKIYEEEKARLEASQISFKERNKGGKRKGSLVASSSYSIAISLILLIAFNFFNQYLALYRPDVSGATLVWAREQVLTSGFNTWLPMLTIGLILSIAGHVFIIILKNYVWQELILIILDLIGIAVILALFYIYPFDFSAIQDKSWAGALPIIINIVLGMVVLGLIISMLVRGIKLIISVTTKVYNE